ncbi:MAG: putative outer rane efflux protein [Labilithrix sp.]|nr:putative outer rane efflux protein [Labilithrix sp.]
MTVTLRPRTPDAPAGPLVRRLGRAARVGAVLAVLLASTQAHAGPLDLDDEGDGDKDTKKDDAKPAARDGQNADPAIGPIAPIQAPIATIKMHAYTLLECLALADRNHPNLWAAKARVNGTHAQLDEATYTPYSFWSANTTFGVLPQIGGTPFYNAVPRTILNQGLGSSYQPFLQFGLRGTVPIYTFGKISSIKRAAEAQVRYQEWDVEKVRTQIRMDVRRAFYSLMAARDALYIADDVLGKLNGAIDNTQKKLSRGDTSVDEGDRLRLEIYRDELLARVAEARRGESYATAALRFLTGVQTGFDIPDEPLKRPETPLGPVVRYLTAARLFRPDINQARAGVAARRAQVDFARAQFFPNLGVGVGFTYNVAPSATPQNTAWIGDGYNGFGAGFAFGAEWGLDILPKNARVNFAESQLEEARSLERYALGGVGVEVEAAHAAAVEAKTREENWERAEHRSKRWISSVQDAVDLGTKDDRYIIDPLRAYVFARANHVQALLDFNVALSELARVTGWDPAAPSS